MRGDDAGRQSNGGRPMIRKLILPALAALVLAGCATGYQYRGGSGDYYYGSPGVEYRYYGYGYYGYPYGSYGYYGYPNYYGGYYGGYYSPWYRRPHWHGGHHHGGGDHGGGHGGDKPAKPTPPWRDLGSLRPRTGGNMPPSRMPATPASPSSSQPRMPAPGRRVVRPQIEPTAPRPAVPSRTVRPSAPAPRMSLPRSSGGGEGHPSGSKMSELLRRSQQ